MKSGLGGVFPRFRMGRDRYVTDNPPPEAKTHFDRLVARAFRRQEAEDLDDDEKDPLFDNVRSRLS